MNMEPEDWLAELDQGTLNAPLVHPRIKDFAERVTKRTTELRLEQAISVESEASSILNIEARSLRQSP
jgi:hypothetical protein